MANHEDNPLTHLGFQRFAPSKGLAAYIQCYWFIRSAQHSINSSEYLHPDGGISITFNYGDSLKFDDGLNVGDITFDGANTTTRSLHLNCHVDTVGIRFLPAGARAFLAMPLNEFKGQLLSITDTPLTGYDELYQKLADESEYIKKVALLEAWLSQVINPQQTELTLVNAALQILEQYQGAIAISTLAAKLAVNQRRLERLFNDQVGLTAKEYGRNIRIKQARFYLKQHSNVSLADVAYNLGFFDQAHFSKQFKYVVGISPKAYAAKSKAAATS